MSFSNVAFSDSFGDGFDLESTMAIITVGVGKDHTTIQAAVSAASANDEIQIYPGTYAEEVTISSKDLSLSFPEAGDVIVEGTGLSGEGIDISSSDVSIKKSHKNARLIVQNFTTSSQYGIELTNAEFLSNHGLPIILKGNNRNIKFGGTTTKTVIIDNLYSMDAAAFALYFLGSAQLTVKLNVELSNNWQDFVYQNTNTSTRVDVNSKYWIGTRFEHLNANSGARGAVKLNVGRIDGDGIWTNTSPSGTITLIGSSRFSRHDGIESIPAATTIEGVDRVDQTADMIDRPMRNGSISFLIDDHVNKAAFDELVTLCDARGFKCGISLDKTHTISAGDWTSYTTAVNNGHDISVHTRHAVNLSHLNGFSIEYIGAGSAATMTITSSALTTSITGAADDLNINLSSFADIEALVTDINTNHPTTYRVQTYDNAQPPNRVGYAAADTFGTGTQDRVYAQAGLTTTLADVSAQDITSTYVVLQDEDRYLDEEITNCKNDITTNTGYTPTTFVYPGAFQSYTPNLTSGFQSRGMRIGRAANAAHIYLEDAEPFNTYGIRLTDRLGANSGLTSAQIQARTRAICEWVKNTGANINIYSHGLAEASSADWVLVLDEVQASGVVVETYSQQASEILNGTETTASGYPEITRNNLFDGDFGFLSGDSGGSGGSNSLRLGL